MRFWMFVAASGLAGCTPHLDCPDELSESVDWAAPENSWPVTSDAPGPLSSDGCASSGGYGDGETVGDFLLGDQFGAEVSLWQFYGNVVVLDFSTMWCAPCAELAKEIDATAADYEAQGFTYLTMLTQTSAGTRPVMEDLGKWATDNGISQPVLSVSEEIEFEVVPPGYAYPRIIALDREMRVAVGDIQPIEDVAVREAIESLL